MIKKLENTIRKTLPSPFSIAVILTIIIIFLALLLTDYKLSFVITAWEKGLWNNALMNFAMQMMLMLVLGYVLALTNFSKKIIEKITPLCNNSANAAFWVSLSTILVSFFNWGLGLIFGAILARKVGEYSVQNNLQLNYPLIGAAGYSGLMVWHGGLSGSIPLKIAEENHLQDIITNPTILKQIPVSGIDFSQTVFSNMNLSVSLLLIIIIPLILFLLGMRNSKGSKIKFKKTEILKEKTQAIGAEKIDQSKIFSKIIGLSIILFAIQKVFNAESLAFINPNFINLLLLGLCLFLHKNFSYFIKSVNTAISSASGILIQFPLYFGIMGIMNSTGLVDIFAEFFINISNKNTYPIFTMLSGGLVNIFVPSGGGQWAVQGIIVIQSALELGVSIPKSIMALVYGDQLTNMLQPFWALPLLGITQIKAKELLPYTLIIMVIGIVIFTVNLIIF
ncbi:MAG: short-chain fatty acid transporter [Flavobacteriales bacterium TMED191]|nr:MAG: short-chain fatty acid transporter [Flavobacteriales bacterium TMED191]|tara:strand:+ start:76 stop:1425 length:1350 start_codon:yes stop_codon:yes gene_type:complete